MVFNRKVNFENTELIFLDGDPIFIILNISWDFISNLIHPVDKKSYHLFIQDIQWRDARSRNIFPVQMLILNNIFMQNELVFTQPIA